MRPITAADLMNPVVLSVDEGMTVRELAAFLLDNEITGAPVADAAGRLVGVVSLTDVAEALLDDGDDEGSEEEGAEDPDEDEEGDEDAAADELTVADVMTSGIRSVGEDASVSEVAMTLLKEHLHRLLVTRDGEPVGIISTSDLLGLLVEDDG